MRTRDKARIWRLFMAGESVMQIFDADRKQIIASPYEIEAIIREGATQKLQDVIVGGKSQGMQFMDDAIWAQLQQGHVSPHEAFMKAIDKNRFKAFLPEEEAELANSAGGAA
jgi:twitching motility protein PilT